MAPIVKKINLLEEALKKLSDDQLKAKTPEFKERLAKGESLDSILPEAFAVVREASVRTLGLRHFDVQLMGGMALNSGRIAEMKTGEGKTLTSTLPIYLNAITEKGVHVVTVNDYLARRDSEWMKPIYDFLGLSVGYIISNLDHTDRQKAYAADITYGTNNEFGFDYLRDNMVEHKSFKVQRGHYFSIVDEVDSILIDEARTPLIISGPADMAVGGYAKVNKIIPRLEDKVDFEIDEKARSILLTETGVSKVEKLLGVPNLYDPAEVEQVHHVHQCLKAHHLFKRDVDYVVQGQEIIIVDEFTGRLMEGRRYSDGLHQAIEAKEHVEIKQENQTLATITFQNYFRMYDKLSGMTGTADTEAEEFNKIYNLDVVVLPTNKPMKRIDHPDKVYRNEKEKFEAIAEDVKDCHLRGQPVLLGTVSIENSEKLSSLLNRKGIPHAVLNAKFHEKEADIVKDAGQRGRVTIATNMAGRGTDIVLGQGVREAGGLHIIGSERHESRRIDNQLRGRSGRQGDPGSSRFYLSLEDHLMRVFGSDKLGPIMQRFGMQEGESLEHKMISKAIERAQKRVEAHNFDIRKYLLEYDDVMNTQRQYVYSIRNEILDNENISELIKEYFNDTVNAKIEQFLPGRNALSWDINELLQWLKSGLGVDALASGREIHDLSKMELKENITELISAAYTEKKQKLGAENMQMLERMVALQVIDQKWKDHLYSVDQLREGVWALGYAERNPLVEYRIRAFEAFQNAVVSIKEDTMEFLFHANISHPIEQVDPEEMEYQEVGQALHSSVESFDMNPNAAFANEKQMVSRKQSTRSAKETAKNTAGGASTRKSGRRKRR